MLSPSCTHPHARRRRRRSLLVMVGHAGVGGGGAGRGKGSAHKERGQRSEVRGVEEVGSRVSKCASVLPGDVLNSSAISSGTSCLRQLLGERRDTSIQARAAVVVLQQSSRFLCERKGANGGVGGKKYLVTEGETERG